MKPSITGLRGIDLLLEDNKVTGQCNQRQHVRGMIARPCTRVGLFRFKKTHLMNWSCMVIAVNCMLFLCCFMLGFTFSLIIMTGVKVNQW